MNILPFAFQSHPVRSIVIDGDPWFHASDVAQALGYANPAEAVSTHVDPEDKHSVALGLAGRAPTFINEAGLYSLVLRSQLPSARAFKRWVTSEVLPSIRKTGTYRLPPGYAEFLAAKRRELEAADREIERRTERCYIKIPCDVERIAAITAAVAERRGLSLQAVECLRSSSVDQVMAVEYGDPEAIARIASLRSLPTLSR